VIYNACKRIQSMLAHSHVQLDRYIDIDHLYIYIYIYIQINILIFDCDIQLKLHARTHIRAYN
jgi:hypothetical protein